VREALQIWRLHWEEPNEVAVRAATAPPRYRFDDPRSEYGVTYGNLDIIGAFLEVYGDTQRIDSAQRGRRRTRLESTREILLVDLDNAATQKAFGLDSRIASSRQYATTQHWSRAWHDWYPEVDGIRYRSRHENDTLNLCLFLDRCGSDMTIGESGRLQDLDRRDLLGLVAPYRITVDW
jgi:RES domain